MKETKNLTAQNYQHQLPRTQSGIPDRISTNRQQEEEPKEPLPGSHEEVADPNIAEEYKIEQAFQNSDYPPLWKQKKLLIGLLGNLVLIIAICWGIFIVLRG